VQQIHWGTGLCQKIAAVEGVGPLTATAVVAAIAYGRTFHNGRQIAARTSFQGNILVATSRAHFGITKRGDPYLRTLLIHGARSVMCRAPYKQDSRSPWITEKQRQARYSEGLSCSSQQERTGNLGVLARDEPYRRAA
jgi:transposase